MTTATGENTDRFRQFRGPELGAEQREAFRREAEGIAFGKLLLDLGRDASKKGNLAEGDTTMSIPEFFRLPKFANPLNEAALAMLPQYSHVHRTSVKVDGLRAVLEADYDLETAVRTHRSPYFVIRDKLGLDDPHVTRGVRDITNCISRVGSKSWHHGELETLVRMVGSDLREGIVAEVSEIADLVRTGGYVDFLDYLVAARGTITHGVELIFSPEVIPEPM